MIKKIVTPNWELYNLAATDESIENVKPWPPVRRYSKKGLKRPVVAEIARFDMCPSARHYYVNIKEDDDPVWDGRWQDSHNRTGYWTHFYGDKEYDGEKFHKKFDDPISAREWVLTTFKKNFSSRTHRLNMNSFNAKMRYLREGD